MQHKIEWLNAPGYKGETLTIIPGCSPIGPGCQNCWAQGMAYRQTHMRPGCEYCDVMTGKKWNGQTVLLEDRLEIPFTWRKPRMVGLNLMGDLFHEATPFKWIDKVFAMMALTPQHRYLILTKRPRRMADYLNDHLTDPAEQLSAAAYEMWGDYADDHAANAINGVLGEGYNVGWPMKNLWLGTSVENQRMLDQRWPFVAKSPAVVRFVSVEPMLGPVELNDTPAGDILCHCGGCMAMTPTTRLDWVICGGEAGANSRPMDPDWVRSLRDQCETADIPFMLKQWGEWLPFGQGGMYSASNSGHPTFIDTAEFGDGRRINCKQQYMGSWSFYRVGKKAAGRKLDGVEHLAFPEVAK